MTKYKKIIKTKNRIRTKNRKKNKNNKTKKNIKKAKYILGGNNDRIPKLKKLIELILNYCYFTNYIGLAYKTKFYNIPENEQKPSPNGFGLRVRKKIGEYTFDEYMENKIPEYPSMNDKELMKYLALSWQKDGFAYKLFPDNMLSDEYVIKIDEEIKKIADELNNLINNDNEDDYNEDAINGLYEKIQNSLFNKLFVNKMINDFDFFIEIITPKIEEIYNINN